MLASGFGFSVYTSFLGIPNDGFGRLSFYRYSEISNEEEKNLHRLLQQINADVLWFSGKKRGRVSSPNHIL